MKKSFFKTVFNSLDIENPNVIYSSLINILENEVLRINKLNKSEEDTFYIEGVFENNNCPVKYAIKIDRVEGSDYITLESLSCFNWFIQINFYNNKHEKIFSKFYDNSDFERKYYSNFLKYPIKLFCKSRRKWSFNTNGKGTFDRTAKPYTGNPKIRRRIGFFII